MNVYEANILTAAPAAGAAYVQLRAGARQLRIRSIGATQRSATQTEIAIARSLAAGTASGTVVAPQPRDPVDAAALSVLETTWSAAPTIAGTPVYLKRYILAPVIGNGRVWTWPSDAPFIVPPNGGLLLWNPNAGVGVTVSFDIELEE